MAYRNLTTRRIRIVKTHFIDNVMVYVQFIMLFTMPDTGTNITDIGTHVLR